MLIDLTPALPTFVITFREGVEAALVVGIVMAYLQKAEKLDLKPWVWGGVWAGLLASGVVGGLCVWCINAVSAANQEYTPVIKPFLNGVFSIAAIAMLSWMLIWMTRQARLLKSEVEGAIGSTLQASASAGWGIAGLVFFAVLREGFETVLFIAAKSQQGWGLVLGAIAGLMAAVLFGTALFKWGVRINVRQFFQVMGGLLLLIVAGLVVSALAHIDSAIAALTHINAQFADRCLFQGQATACLLGPLLWDTHQILPEKRFPGIILHTLFGYEDQVYLAEAVGYLGFLAIVGSIYWQSLTGGGTKSGDKQPITPTPAQK